LCFIRIGGARGVTPLETSRLSQAAARVRWVRRATNRSAHALAEFQILGMDRLKHPLLANEGPISLLGRLRRALRVRRMSPRTEEAYVRWVKRYVRFHGRAHPRDLGAGHVTAFLTQLAVGERVGASSQNQALGALLFLYRHVLDQPIPWIHDVVRARRVRHLPAVLSRAEVQEVLVELSGSARLVALLLYGSGLRLMEALTLRVKDLMLERGIVTVRQGKGGKDRVTVLPRSSIAPLRAHLAGVYGHSSATSVRGSLYRCLTVSHGSGRLRVRRLHGAGSFLQLGRTSSGRRESGDATICMRPLCNALWRRLRVVRGFRIA